MIGAREPLRTSTRSWRGPCVERFPAAQRTLPHLLEFQASALPDDVWLVVDGIRSLTYGQAAEGAHAAARRMSSIDGNPQVGIALRSGLDFVVLLQATLLAGGTAYLLDPAWPAATAADALRGLKLDLLFVDTSDDVDLRGAAAWNVARRTVDVSGDPLARIGDPQPVRWTDWIVDAPRGPASLPRDSADDAIVMFTSGTTGIPKGVVCSHHYSFCYSGFVTDSLGRSRDDVLSTPLPLFHAGGLHMAVHSALHAGCTAHVKSRFSTSRFWQEVAEDGATQANLVSEMARMIDRVAEPVPGHRLRYLIAGGFHDHRAFEERFSTTVLSQGYGTSEAYVSPMRTVPWDDVHTGSDVLGMPLDCFSYGVVTDLGRLLPPGGVGELVLRPTVPGVTFTRYLLDPDATAAVWRDGVLHTGDLAEVDPRGVVRFRGRVAGRIRRKGETVSAAEAERAAMTFPGVVRAAVYAVPGELGDDEIKLDVTGEGLLDLDALNRHLVELLRPAARPRYLEQLDCLPLTATMRPMYGSLRAHGLSRPSVFDARESSGVAMSGPRDEKDPA